MILIIAILLLSNCSGKCTSLEDIYYYPDKLYNPKFFADTQHCPYTLNPLKANITTLYIKRHLYDTYTYEYTDHGLPYPYPKRYGTEGIIQPI